nr:pollen-specific leucine-rich repeat extensin-like protein 1 [Aegilops tauschii subsp. strangulata]
MVAHALPPIAYSSCYRLLRPPPPASALVPPQPMHAPRPPALHPARKRPSPELFSRAPQPPLYLAGVSPPARVVPLRPRPLRLAPPRCCPPAPRRSLARGRVRRCPTRRRCLTVPVGAPLGLRPVRFHHQHEVGPLPDSIRPSGSSATCNWGPQTL